MPFALAAVSQPGQTYLLTFNNKSGNIISNRYSLSHSHNRGKAGRPCAKECSWTHRHMKLVPFDYQVASFSQLQEKLPADRRANLAEFLNFCGNLAQQPMYGDNAYLPKVYAVVHSEPIEGGNILVFTRAENENGEAEFIYWGDDEMLDSFAYVVK